MSTPVATPDESLSSELQLEPAADAGNWWTRTCGGRDVVRIALPLVASTISWSIMNLIDRMLLLWYDADACAASLPAGATMFTLMCFPLGVAAYANTFVAQYVGADRPDRVGLAIWQAVLFSLAVTPLFWCLIPLAVDCFSASSGIPPRWLN